MLFFLGLAYFGFMGLHACVQYLLCKPIKFKIKPVEQNKSKSYISKIISLNKHSMSYRLVFIFSYFRSCGLIKTYKMPSISKIKITPPTNKTRYKMPSISKF